MPSSFTFHIFLFHVPSFFIDLLEMYCLIRMYLKTQRLSISLSGCHVAAEDLKSSLKLQIQHKETA